MKNVLIFLVGLCCILGFSYINDPIEILRKALATYQSEKPSTNLYVHLDKNIYVTNESIWFKAYLLTAPDIDNKTLFVRLTDKNKKVILKYEFPVYDIRANGDILLPDSLREGEYYFYAYTNAMINFSPNQLFVQKIKIFKNSAETMQAEASIVDSTTLHTGDNVNILVKTKKGKTYVTGAKCDFRLLVNDKPVKSGKVTTNLLGEAVISFIYPKVDDSTNVQVRASFNKGADKTELELNLPNPVSPVVVRTYPEGGHLIGGINNYVAVEVSDARNNPLASVIQLKEDDKTIAKITTNKLGTGTFNFTPIVNKHYHFETRVGNASKTIELNTPIEQRGFCLHIEKTGNKYDAFINNRGKSDSVTLVLRNYEKLIWNQVVRLKPGDSVKITLPITGVVKEILSLALFDNKNNCMAERLFMHQEANNYRINLQTDKPVYTKRQKVRVTIDAHDLDGSPILANLSVAVTEKARIDNNTYLTILDACYFKALSTDFAGQYFKNINDDDMDALLITKKWWANSWADILNYRPKGYMRLIKNSGGISGEISRTNHKHIDIKQLVIYAKSEIIPVEVDGNGLFIIAPGNLTADQSERRYLVLGTDFYDKYKIRFENYADQYDESVANTDVLKILKPYTTSAKSNNGGGIDLKGNILLNEVKITGRNKLNELSVAQEGVYPIFKSTTCNDYVCIYNILNCPWHPDGLPPVEGAIYSYKGQYVVYHGCETKAQASNNIQLKTISLPHTFILPDYDKEPPVAPELRSTIYWNPNLNTDKAGKISFDFFTSDITGDFTIIVQGLDKTFRPVYSSANFKVK